MKRPRRADPAILPARVHNALNKRRKTALTLIGNHKGAQIPMALSRRSIDTLLDLVEIKPSCIQALDREDARELATLENCKRELQALRIARNGIKLTPLTEAADLSAAAALPEAASV